MVFRIEPIHITKDLILSRISEENLMEHYAGAPVKKGLFVSKIRNDTRPTCAYFRSNKSGRLLYKDFGTGFTGDFISVVMMKFNCTYSKALQIVANDFGIISRNDLAINKPAMKYTNSKLEQSSEAEIQIEVKDFDDYELNWWGQYGISLDILKKFKVFSCKNVFLNGNLFTLYKPKQLIFGYYDGIREGIERWRIYYTKHRNGYKFLSNWKHFRLQGDNMLPKKGDFLVVTKSLKDVMVLYNFGIAAVAPISENCFLSEAQYNKYKERFKKIYVFYDNDLAGLTNMQKIRHQFQDVTPIWIPRKYNAKDISDFYAEYGHDKTEEFINYAKGYFQS